MGGARPRGDAKGGASKSASMRLRMLGDGGAASLGELSRAELDARIRAEADVFEGAFVLFRSFERRSFSPPLVDFSPTEGTDDSELGNRPHSLLLPALLSRPRPSTQSRRSTSSATRGTLYTATPLQAATPPRPPLGPR